MSRNSKRRRLSSARDGSPDFRRYLNESKLQDEDTDTESQQEPSPRVEVAGARTIRCDDRMDPAAWLTRTVMSTVEDLVSRIPRLEGHETLADTAVTGTD